MNLGNKSGVNIKKLLLLKNKSSKAKTDVEDSYLSSDGESLRSISSSISKDDQSLLNVKKTPKLLKLPNTLFYPGGACVRSCTSYLSDSSVGSNRKSKLSPHMKNMSSGSASIIEKDSSQEDKEKTGTDETRRCNTIESQNKTIVPKPVCNCRQCQHWTSSENWGRSAENFEGECTGTQLNVIRPPTLLLKGTREKNAKLSYIRYNTMSKLQKQASFKIVVHGCLLPTPMERITESSFHPIVHRCLKNMGYTRALKTQTYIWPAVTRHMNVCLIHKEKSGKTLAYLPALCSFLLEKEERYANFKKGGPIATILCPNSAKCEEVYDLTQKLLSGAGNKRPKVLLVTYPFEHINMSSIDLLITIPTVLTEILKRNMTNMKRLCHIVLEDINVLLDHFHEEVDTITKLIDSMLTHRISKQTVQVIAVGEHWTLKVEKFMKVLRDVPVICIGDLLEAVLYGRIKLKVACNNIDMKRDYVIDVLKDKWSFFKSVILCNTDVEVEELKTSLILASISVIAITSNLPKEEILQQEANWEYSTGGSYRVLICTDELMQTMLSVTSAGLLIHYSLPEKWTLLKRRFSCLLENCKSPLIDDNNKLVCEAYILTDGLNEEQICRLVTVLKDYNLSSNEYEKFLKFVEEHKKKKEGKSLCSSLKKFGYCQLPNCCDRHHLDCNLDYNSSLPKNGRIKFKILEVLDVNHYKIHIIEHNDIGKNDFSKLTTDLDSTKLTSLLKLSRKTPDIIEEKKTYAFWDADDFDDVFRECVVEEVQSRHVSILVKDSGRRTNVGHNKIFMLPDGFNQELGGSSSAELIAANVKPPFKDQYFSSRAYLKLKSIVERTKHDDNVFVGNICLQLENVIYVNKITEEVNVFELNVAKCDLIRELFNHKLADRNPNHLKNLHELCESAGIILPVYEVPLKKLEVELSVQVKPQWAFLEMDNTNRVFFSGAVSPEEFYVRLEKFDKLLANLHCDISEVIMRQGSKRDFAITSGKYYLAKDNIDNKFNRVLIKKIENEQALCFAVDYGDEIVVNLEHIRFLPNFLIQKLPFQSILCSLHGIKGISEEWPEESIDVLYDKFSLEPDSDVFRTLFAKCIHSEKGPHSSQSKYSILLKDIYENPILINQLLVDCGWADLHSSDRLEDFDVEFDALEEEEIDQDIEELQDIFDKTSTVASNSFSEKTVDDKEIDSKDENLNSDFECYFGEPDEEIDQFIDFMNAMVVLGQEKMRNSSVTQPLPAIEAAPFEVDYCTPDVYWSQNDQSIKLSIKLANVETYKLKIEKFRIFIFQTTVDDKRYELNLMLYETVEPNFDHNLGGLEIKVNLTKREQLEWPRLTRNKKRLRNIHYMLCKEELDDEKKKLFLDLGDDLRNFEYCGGEKAIMTYMSDLDSEFDSELEEDSDS